MAEIFNQNIINNPNFKGHHLGDRTAIIAFADDTLVHIADNSDLAIATDTLHKANEATGGKTNFNKKSEAIFTGRWKHNPPRIPFKIVSCTKYLGVPVGNNNKEIQEKWEKIIESITKELDYWHKRVSSFPLDRMLILKTMGLSKV